jgi:nicotinamide-nucleotide amidase
MSDVRFACLTIGSELLDGRVVDTNSRFLARELRPYGLRLDHILTCTDESKTIVEALTYLADHYDLILITGGLGPTDDDLTREAVARFCGVRLTENAQAVATLIEMLASRRREVNQSNRRQALIPEGAEFVRNQYGTAPGFSIRKDRCTLVALPGVPRELYGMIREEVLPFLIRQFDDVGLNSIGRSRVVAIRVAGIPESDLNEVVGQLSIPSSTELAYQVKYPEIIVQLRGDDSIVSTMATIVDMLPPECLVSDCGEKGAQQKLLEILRSRNETLALTETVTAGLLLHELSRQEQELGSNVVKGGWLLCGTGLDELAAVREIKNRCSADWSLGIFQTEDSRPRIILVGAAVDFSFEIDRSYASDLKAEFLSWAATDVARRELSGQRHFPWIRLKV